LKKKPSGCASIGLKSWPTIHIIRRIDLDRVDFAYASMPRRPWPWDKRQSVTCPRTPPYSELRPLSAAQRDGELPCGVALLRLHELHLLGQDASSVDQCKPGNASTSAALVRSPLRAPPALAVDRLERGPC
jgi:hypothetical protein